MYKQLESVLRVYRVYILTYFKLISRPCSYNVQSLCTYVYIQYVLQIHIKLKNIKNCSSQLYDMNQPTKQTHILTCHSI